MSSNPHVIQSIQGGRDDAIAARKSNAMLGDDLLYDADRPRELLTSEIDLISRVDQFRSSTTSLQGLMTAEAKNVQPSAQLKV